MGIIATRSLDKEVTGLKDLMVQHEARIRNGMVAYSELEKLRAGDRSPELMASFKENQKDLGYGLLLKKYTENVTDASEAHIQASNKRYDSKCNRIVLLFPCNGRFWFLDATPVYSCNICCGKNVMQKINRGYLNLHCLHCHYLGLQHKQVGMWLKVVVNHGPLVKCCLHICLHQV